MSIFDSIKGGFTYEALTGREKPESIIEREKKIADDKIRREIASDIQGGGLKNTAAFMSNYLLAEPLAFVGSVLPGETFTYDNLEKKLRTPLTYDERAIKQYFGKDIKDFDENETAQLREFIRKYDVTSGVIEGLSYLAGTGVGTKAGAKATQTVKKAKDPAARDEMLPSFVGRLGKEPPLSSVGASRVDELSKQIDFTKSLDDNLKNLQPLVGSRVGDSLKKVTPESLKRSVTQIMNNKLQDSVEGYKETYKKMLSDRNYMPPKDYFNPLKLKISADSMQKSIKYRTSNQNIALKELSEELNMSRAELTRLTGLASKNRQKIRSKAEAKAQGPEALAKWYQTNYGTPKIKRRETEAGAFKLSDYENAIRKELFEKRKLENIDIKNNEIYANKNIFENPRFMDMLSTMVDPKTGSILKVDATEKIKKLIADNKFWQVDHIQGVEQKSKMLAVPANLQLIPGILNSSFKRNAEIFIANNAKNPNAKQKIDDLIKKSVQLRITLRPEGIGRLGYKQPVVEKGMHAERLDEQINFYYSTRQGFAPFGGLVESIQQEIKDIAASDRVTRIRKPVEKKIEDIQEEAKIKLRTERPVKFKTSELFTSAPRELLLKPVGKLMTFPQVASLNAIETVYNSLRKGTENDIDMKSRFPSVYKMYDYYNTGIGPTPDDQTYIGFVDETIRSVQKGAQNLGYNTLDLAFALPDYAFDTKLQERLKKEYDENAFANPETFLGNVGAILTEFGVPSGVGVKFINLLRKGVLNRFGLNLFTTSTYGMKGAQKAKTAVSNVAKRVGVVAPAAFAGEFVGGGQYNTVSREFADDPLFLDETLGYDYIDTSGLSGRDLVVANFKNRLRFGADGAIIAGMFPLVGPALWKTTKYGALKPSLYLAGKGLQLANYIAIKPASYLLARTPGVAQAGQYTAQAVGIGAKFLGKDVMARLAVSAMGSPTLKQLPEFKKWRMFEVTSSDPLEGNLKRFDNFLALFRDTANQSANRFFVTGQTSRKIKALSRKIEKQLDSVEVRAYDLARGFLREYNTNTVSPAKQEYYLDQVLAYLKGQIKVDDLPDALKEPSQALNKTFVQIKKDFADVLPDGAGLKDFLNTNLRQYMRASFASFTNPLYRPDKQTFERAVDFMVDRINKNENMVEAAVRASNQPTDVAIRDFARRQVESILERGKFDGKDPLEQLTFIARQNLKMDDLVVQTGEELPQVIRDLLGQETGLRQAVMTTAADLASQTANSKMYDNLANLGLKEGWLFNTAEEAIAAGIANPKKIGPRLPGLGKLESPVSKLYGNPEIVESLVNTSGQFNNKIVQGIYQSLIGYKAMVQTGKTVYSPATQTRNFGSAGFFPLQSGHIGGTASVQDAFKIILDDIFGAGRVANEQQLIDRITRKIELGVLDENVVVSELKDILQELKAGGFKTFNALSDRIDQAQLSRTATRLYAGGDNVWKWYGHEFVMSQIKNGFKNVDDISAQYKAMFGADISPKTLEEGIEQYAATLIRETYPTYSKVPKLIQTIRKIPFIGNFVSFPAEILRTTFATSAYAGRHIASDNPVLRELGYRTLMGQMITYGGIGAATTAFAHAMTNVTSQEIEDIKKYFAPDFMRYSDLVPMTDVEDGVIKVFDNSRYFPYDLITSTTGNLINRVFTQREQLDPDQIETDMFKDLYSYTGPFADLAGGTLFGVAIGYEPVADMLRGGKTKTGSAIYSKTDTSVEKFDKMMAHIFQTINPGFIRTIENFYKSAAGLLTGTGQPIKFTDESFKLVGGSPVTIDIKGSFRYQIGRLKSSFKEPRVSEGFYRPDFRTAEQLVREYNEQNEEAFREQYEFYKIVRAALRNDFMTKREIRDLLKERVGKDTARAIVNGEFTPLSFVEGALEGRFDNIKRGNPDEIFFKSDFVPRRQLKNAKNKWDGLKFEDYERELREPKSSDKIPEATIETQQTSQAPQVPPLPDTPQPTVSPVSMVNQPSNRTGLTDAESVYLGPTEQLYRRRERGIT